MYYLRCPRTQPKIKHLPCAFYSYNKSNLLIFLAPNTFPIDGVVAFAHNHITFCVTYSLKWRNANPLWKQCYCFTVHCDPFPTLFHFKIGNLKVRNTERLSVFQFKALHLSTSANCPHSTDISKYISRSQFSLFSSVF